jgi:hypothetical protein
MSCRIRIYRVIVTIKWQKLILNKRSISLGQLLQSRSYIQSNNIQGYLCVNIVEKNDIIDMIVT